MVSSAPRDGSVFGARGDDRLGCRDVVDSGRDRAAAEGRSPPRVVARGLRDGRSCCVDLIRRTCGACDQPRQHCCITSRCSGSEPRARNLVGRPARRRAAAAGDRGLMTLVLAPATSLVRRDGWRGRWRRGRVSGWRCGGCPGRVFARGRSRTFGRRRR
jgi:hypothetical protein